MIEKPFQIKTSWLKWIVFAWLAMIATASHAQDPHCAWLNDATASGVLNGPVTLTLETAPNDQALCVFTTGKTVKDYSTLRIAVQPLKGSAEALHSHASLCTSQPTALKGIGNEAMACSADVGYSRGEQVIGHARDWLFIVTASSTMAQSPTMTRPLLQEKAKMIAEQVAGALF